MIALGVLLAVVEPLGGFHAARCGVLDDCRPAAAPVRERSRPTPRPRPRLRSALDIATQGRYVALGDSYSAGEGAYRLPGDLAPGNRCHRTSQAYFHAIADTFPFHKGSAFWACSGVTTGDMLRGGAGQPPQVDRVTADTSLVTLSIGGNDVGFAQVLSRCVVQLPWSKDCQAQGPQIDAQTRALRASLQTVLSTLVAKAPLARVIVVGYPRIFSDTAARVFEHTNIANQRWLNQRAKALDDVIRQVVQAADQRIIAAHGAGSVEYVDTLYTFAGHEIGTKDPFVNDLDVDLSALSVEARSFHPNADGYRRLAASVSKQIVKGPGRAILQYRPPA